MTMTNYTNPSHICASMVLRQFESDTTLQPSELPFWRSELTTFIDVLLSESQLDPCIALTALHLLERYHAFLNRTLLVTELYQVFFAAFMITCKIVQARKRVAWVKIGARVLDEGQSVLWLEREFLMDIRWEDDMLEIVEEVWAAYSDAKGSGRRPNGSGSEHAERPIRRQLSTASSFTIESDDSDHARRSTLVGSHLALPRPSILRSPLKSNDSGSRFSQSSTTSTDTSDSSAPTMRYLDKVLNPAGSQNSSSEFLDGFPKLRHRVSTIFGVKKGGT
ncbi:hypothetical protein BKA70DRAFT_554321 [Coprinopsis sp. MPI-PUGE-AT-0042]|nr:hypothetical protein BKA70DRAFT_554321 [Coprinopsis sp. MPI-PUGE-AT-0042]